MSPTPTGRTYRDWNGHLWHETNEGWQREDGITPPQSLVTTTHHDGTVTKRWLCLEQRQAEGAGMVDLTTDLLIRRFADAQASDDPDAVNRVFESIRHTYGTVVAMNCRYLASRPPRRR